VIDFFVVNYCKENPVLYYLLPSGQGYSMSPPYDGATAFNVYSSYKQNGKAFNKSGFDMFCRRKQKATKATPRDDVFQVVFRSKSDGMLTFSTNLSQLRFFAWAIKNCVIDYVRDHKQEIIDDMNSTLAQLERPQVQPNEKVTHKKRKLKTGNTFIQTVDTKEQIGFKKVCCR
jgi:hypothetical protein